MRGKYSPTVSVAYMRDQEWWLKYAGTDQPDVYVGYDPEGFDRYGCDKNDVDRAGNHEHDYYHNDAGYDGDEDYNLKYDAASDAWGFDGVRPCLRG